MCGYERSQEAVVLPALLHSHALMYSEQQNHSTKGQNLLVSQIVAWRTKETLWENHETKQYM